LGAARLRAWLVPSLAGAPAHLATAVLALALLLLTAQLLGSFGLFELGPYLASVVLVAIAAHRWGDAPSAGGSRSTRGPADRRVWALVGLLIAAAALALFAAEAKTRLGTGMTGFDSTWYHAPFAAQFFQSGDTWDLHFIAPQFLAWFYPANSEVFHAIGMLAFERDILSPLLNLGWFAGCLLATWCIGRPYGVAPFSLALGAVALSVPALADQAGEARNDIVGAFFLLAAVAIALNSRTAAERRLPAGALLVVGLAAGLAAGTKLNFLLPAAVLVLGLPLAAPARTRTRVLAVTTLGALLGGGYWYLRNLVHSGNPLPWVDRVGPVSLPAPDQALGGREGHSVLAYLTDGGAWSDWFLPGLADGLSILWPLLGALALASLFLSLGRRAGSLLRIAGLAGLAAAAAWLIAPTSASGPEGAPRGFESGLRYLAPALVLGLALLPTARAWRHRLAELTEVRSSFVSHTDTNSERTPGWRGHRTAIGLAAALIALAVAIGYPVQRHYLEGRYADPSFTTPGLNAAFAWARDVSDARIATTGTRQFPLFGLDLSNRVEYVGVERPHGGFVAPSSCTAWRRLLKAGDYDYVVASRDRVEPGKPPYPPSARWTAAAGAEIVLREPPTVVFELRRRLDPSAC
jgi:hypothetical protein